MIALAAAERFCLHCGLAAHGGEFCCTGCSWMYRLQGGPGGEEARPESVLPRVLLSAVLALGTMVFSLALIGIDPHVESEASKALQGIYRLGALALAFPILVLLGLPLFDAVTRARRWRSADGLILIAVGAAFLLSTWNTLVGGGSVYFDTASFVLVLVSLGRWLDARARSRATDDLKSAAADSLRPVIRVGPAGEREVPLADVVPGDLLRVRAGEELSVDGVVIEGRAFVDSASMTGEELPREAVPGSAVLAGMRALDGTLLVRTEAVGRERVVAEVERRMRAARLDRAPLVRLADKISGALLPVIAAVALASGIAGARAEGTEAGLLRTLSVLLISCPCALGLAIPLTYQSTLGATLRRGVLLRDGATLERLARVRTVLFDKTGTLTQGTPELVDVEVEPGSTRAAVLAAAVALESATNHPLARALRAAHGEAAVPPASDLYVLPGLGVEGRVAGRDARLVRAEPRPGTSGTAVELTLDGRRAARFTFAGRPRPGASAAVEALRRRGLELFILTGDGAGPAGALAGELGLGFEAGLLPADKLERVQARGGRGVLFVGDGINDAAALAAADVGAVLHGAADVARGEAAVELLHADLRVLPELLVRARRAVRVARGNLAWAFGYNAVGVALAASGRLTPVFAASAMVVSSVLVALRAARLAED